MAQPALQLKERYEPGFWKRLGIWLAVYLLPQIGLAFYMALQRNEQTWTDDIFCVVFVMGTFPLALLPSLPVGYPIYLAHFIWSLSIKKRAQFRFALIVLVILVIFTAGSWAAFDHAFGHVRGEP